LTDVYLLFTSTSHNLQNVATHSSEGKVRAREAGISAVSHYIATSICFRADINRGSGDVVTFIVSKADIRFVVHKAVITARTSAFRAAFDKEQKTVYDAPIIQLLNEEPETVGSVVYWLYHDSIYVPVDLWMKDNHMAVFPMLAKLWVFADKYNISQLKNDAIDGIMEDYGVKGWKFPFQIIQFIYENTPVGSKLRKLLIHLAIEGLKNEDLTSHMQDLPPQFNLELAQFAMKIAATGVSGGENAQKARLTTQFCVEYHDHTAQEQEGNSRFTQCVERKILV
jgi:hypothetical protein